MDKDNVLMVRMFGGFSMSWNGQMLTGGTKSDDTQLARLLQILLHYREAGVERSSLMQILDEDSNADDVHHLLRSVLYNARKKLRMCGLPESNYIEFRNGRYYWTQDIEVCEDARLFEELCEQAEHEADPEKREQLYRDACYLYRGEFLPHQTRLIWVSEEDRRYTQLFRACVQETAEILRVKRDYVDMEALGRHASGMSPFNEWETLTMEALISLGRYREAQRLYEGTIETYQKEMGVRPSLSMISKLEDFTAGLELRSADPEDIREQLAEAEVGRGGFLCSYPVFEGIYRMIRRSVERFGSSAFLMICTVVRTDAPEDVKAVPVDNDKLSRLSERIKGVICSSVRRSDTVCRFSREQFLIILLNSTEEECNVVRDRINRNMRLGGYNISLEYDISPVYGIGASVPSKDAAEGMDQTISSRS